MEHLCLASPALTPFSCHPNPVSTTSQFTANGRYLLLASLDNTLRLWDCVERRVVREYGGHRSESLCGFACLGRGPAPSGAAAAAERPLVVATGGEDRCVRVWDAASEELLATLPGRGRASDPGDGHCDAVLAVDAHPTAALLASGGMKDDATVKLWTAEPRRQ